MLLTSFIIFLMVTFHGTYQAGREGKCGFGTITQYMKVANTDVSTGHDLLIQPVSLESCEFFCTSNRAPNGLQVACKSFAYDKTGQSCFLIDGTEHPKAKDLTSKTGVDLYEKLCLTAPQTCLKIPAFLKVPKHVLIGFAQLVVEEVQTEELCLAECLVAPTKLDFVCLSALFFEELNECVLNFESRLGFEEFFKNDTEGPAAHYYENLCTLRHRNSGQKSSECAEHGSATYIQLNGTELSDFSMDSFKGISIQDCIKKCENTENFTCQAANYRELDSICSLTFVDSLTAAVSRAPDSTLLERHCVQDAQLLCQGIGISFNGRKGIQLLGATYFNVSGVSFEECLGFCLQDPAASCSSLNFLASSFTCQLNEEVGQFEEAERLIENEDSIFLKNGCMDLLQAQLKNNSQAPSGEIRLPSRIADIELTTQCHFGNIQVNLNAQQPFSGYVFAKNKFDYCRIELLQERSAELTLRFPDGINTDDCGVNELNNNVFGATIIVATNNLGIPGLVTNTDRFFNVSCDYSRVHQNQVTATGANMNITDGKFIANLYPGGQIYIPDPVQMSLTREETADPVQVAVLGEQMLLRWTYAPSFNRSNMGIFVRNCNASRGTVPRNRLQRSPAPESLILIENGCPASAVKSKIVTGTVTETLDGFAVPFQTFRFDGSRSVKISCQIDMCEGPCHQTSCTINGQQLTSWGRRRKRTAAGGLENGVQRTRTFGAARAVKQRRSALLTFQVLDRVSDPQHGDSFLEKSQNYYRNPEEVGGQLMQKGLEKIELTKKQLGNLCIGRGTFITVFLFLAVLAFCQVTVVALYLTSRWLHSKKVV